MDNFWNYTILKILSRLHEPLGQYNNDYLVEFSNIRSRQCKSLIIIA